MSNTKLQRSQEAHLHNSLLLVHVAFGQRHVLLGFQVEFRGVRVAPPHPLHRTCVFDASAALVTLRTRLTPLECHSNVPLPGDRVTSNDELAQPYAKFFEGICRIQKHGRGITDFKNFNMPCACALWCMRRLRMPMCRICLLPKAGKCITTPQQQPRLQSATCSTFLHVSSPLSAASPVRSEVSEVQCWWGWLLT